MMQFDWTTFILEILNFLVLLWILQRFLYRPVLATLDARQQRIKDQIALTEQLRSDAEALRQQYASQLADWQLQQESSRRQLDDELTQMRNAAQEKLKQSLADEETKLRIRNQSLLAAREAALIKEAAGAAYAQAAAMLQRVASPQLTRKLVDVFVEDLQQLPDIERVMLRKAAEMLHKTSGVEVVSAHPLIDEERTKLTASLSITTGKALSMMFKEDANLIAGLRVTVGECQLHVNLADELAFFKRQAQHD